MTRRRLVALVSAAVLLVLGLVVVSTVFFVTRTTAGRDKLRSVLQPFIASKVQNGSIYIGHLSGNLLTSVTLDSFAIRDKRGELFVSSGPLTVSFNPRDLIDNRIYITSATVEHPYVHLIQHESGVWNFQEIFASKHSAPPMIKDPQTRNFGDYVVLDSIRARDGAFSLSMPWHAEEKAGPVRDSVIKAHLTNPAKGVARTFEGYTRTYIWKNAHGMISHVRLADPDSDRKYGRQFDVDSISVDEIEPTFKFRRVSASIQQLADTARFAVRHFDMPGSTGTGKGKVWWGSDLPVRYDIAIHGDSVSLDDVNWVYPTLPRTGGGMLDLLIKNDPKNLHIVDFKLTKMDVRTTKSHLVGDMSFGTGAPLLLVRNVDLRVDPLDFDLIRTLAGKPFPQDWQGQINGTVKARGGPLTHFVVDDARGTYTDKHVSGAVSRFSGKGELDILLPANTQFHGFDVNVGLLDLRTIEYLFPAFPKMGGTVAGTATLDSSYLDVRFSNAHLMHQDGPGEPSRVSGSGRITDATPFMVYDVALDAEPLSLTMLARSPVFAALPARGLVSGPIRVKGTSADLELVTSLQGPAGTLSFDGRLDIDSVGGYGARGRGQFSALNLGTLLELPAIPAGTFSGHYDLDVAGSTAASLNGSANLAIERTLIDSVRVYPSNAHVRFAEGRVLVDSLRIHTSAATLTATGGIGLPKGRSDTLSYALVVDSLGGLRHYISHPNTSRLGDATPPDSLSGTVTLSGIATGTLDRLDLSGRMTGSNLYVNQDRGELVDARYALRDVLNSRSGTVTLRADTVVLAGVALDTVGGSLRIDDATHAQFSLGALSHTGPEASAAGAWTSLAGTQSVLLDSLGVAVGDSRWHLSGPARLSFDSSTIAVDSLVLRNRDTAFVALTARIPNSGAAFGQISAAHFPLRDFGMFAQLTDTLNGYVDVIAAVTGTKAVPQISANVALSGIEWRGVGVDRISTNARYQLGRFNVDMSVVRQGQASMVGNASLPLNMSLFGYSWRNDTLSGRVVADSADLSIVKTVFKQLKSVTGRLWADVGLSGTPRAPIVDGKLTVRNGSFDSPLGVTVSDINGRVFGGKDSLNLDFRAATTDDGPGTVAVTGWVKNLLRAGTHPTFAVAVGANGFHAMNKRSLATMVLTTTDPIRLTGSTASATLTGALRVDRGAIFLADRDIARKQAVEIIIDSIGNTAAASTSSAMMSALMSNLQANVTVTLGNDVRLRSKEVNVKLAGDLQLITATTRSTRTVASTGQLLPRFELVGGLRTVSGTYNLNLGLVQREFEVLPEGTVTFDGPPENPALDIKAQYNVKQFRDRDLGVIVNLHGRLLPYPIIDFASTADYEISTSDLLSYLLTGRPGFDFGANATTQQVLTSFLAPTLSAVAADRLRQNLGSFFDAFQFQLGSSAASTDANAAFFSRTNLSQYLYGSTIGAEKQFSNNFYINVNTGLCQLGEAGGRFNALNGLGGKIGYRFDPTLSLQLAYDPSTSSRTCSQSQSIIGFVPTPPQFSFSLSHTWRF
jgi:translocation and assembly module TamB